MKKLSVCMLFTLSLTTLSYAGRAERRGPPPEAKAACSSKSQSDTCSFEGRRGDTLTGTCMSGRDGELACRPKNHKRRRKNKSNDSEE